MKKPLIAVVIPNWNGVDMIVDTLASLRKQTQPHIVVVVENGSTDGSRKLLRPLAKKGELILLEQEHNLGFDGGVNVGISYALDNNYDAVALLNNDATVEKDWLKHLVDRLFASGTTGIVTCKLLSHDRSFIDSTGDWLTIWGLPYPRGRTETAINKYDKQTSILGASAGATLYRSSMLRQIGIFDNDFFAYYEDVDISLRARLYGWQIFFEPKAEAYHLINMTGNRIKGFMTYQTMKNMPWVLIKNLPLPLFIRVYPRFLLAYWSFVASAIVKGNGWAAIKGALMSTVLTPKKIWQRWEIQRNSVLSAAELDAMLLHDLPPNATKLRTLRAAWWRIRGKR